MVQPPKKSQPPVRVKTYWTGAKAIIMGQFSPGITVILTPCPDKRMRAVQGQVDGQEYFLNFVDTRKLAQVRSVLARKLKPTK